MAGVFIGPFRWAFLSDDENHILQLAGFLFTLAAFFIIVILLNKDQKKQHGA